MKGYFGTDLYPSPLKALINNFSIYTAEWARIYGNIVGTVITITSSFAMPKAIFSLGIYFPQTQVAFTRELPGNSTHPVTLLFQKRQSLLERSVSGSRLI